MTSSYNINKTYINVNQKFCLILSKSIISGGVAKTQNVFDQNEKVFRKVE